MALLALSTGVQSRGISTHASIHPSKARSVIYIGEVNAKSARRFWNLVAGYLNRNISLDVLVKPSVPGEFEKLGYLAYCFHGQLAISMGRTDESGVELVRNGPCRSVGRRFPIKGEFFVVSGGFSQGTSSLGLLPPRRDKAHASARREKPRVRF
jgi:hypothetical protein